MGRATPQPGDAAPTGAAPIGGTGGVSPKPSHGWGGPQENRSDAEPGACCTGRIPSRSLSRRAGGSKRCDCGMRGEKRGRGYEVAPEGRGWRRGGGCWRGSSTGGGPSPAALCPFRVRFAKACGEIRGGKKLFFLLLFFCYFYPQLEGGRVRPRKETRGDDGVHGVPVPSQH